VRMHETIERALALSRADECVVIGSRSSQANLRWANNTTTTNGVVEDASLAIISIVGGAVGVVRRDHVPDDALEDLVRESEAACEGKPPAEDAMPLVEATTEPRDWTDEAARTDVSVFAGAAAAMAEMFARARAEDVLTFGYAEHAVTNTWLGTSTGLRRRFVRPYGQLDFTGKSAGFARSSWAGRLTRTFDDVDIGAMYADIRRRLAWSERRSEVPAGRHEVLLTPSCVADMAIYQYWMSDRRDADEGQTVFGKPGGGNKVGEKLFAGEVSIYSDPAEPVLEYEPFVAALRSTAAHSVFDNGLERGRTDWVRDGVLTALVTPRYWAKRAGGEAVPSAGTIAFDHPGGPSLQDMIARTDRALLVNCFWYIRSVDPQTLLLTGLTRDGVFLVEHGEVKGAVNNFRFNMSPVTMFANAIEIGPSEVTLPREFDTQRAKAPPMRVADFHFSSVSNAT